MRSTILLLGALLGRNQKAVLPFPGGCIIGMRPIDIHITAMQKFGAVFEEQDGMLLAEAGRWDAQTILLRFPSVGATENAILAAVYAKGLTCIQNCAREPEIAELCCFLKEKGAKIQGEGTSCIWIRGVDVLQDSTYTLMPDRIVAGTYLIAGAATRGKITLHGIQMHNMEAVAELLRQMGAAIVCEKDTCYLDGRKAVRPLECVCTESCDRWKRGCHTWGETFAGNDCGSTGTAWRCGAGARWSDRRRKNTGVWKFFYRKRI